MDSFPLLVLEKDAIVKEVVAMHVSIGHFGSKTPAISTQIGELERLLTSNHDNAFNAVRNGSLPLVINTDKLDVIARLILLKEKLETSSSPMRWIVCVSSSTEIEFAHRLYSNGGAEAHLIAKEIAKANIAVILNPPRQKPDQWDGRRVLDGLPLTQQSALVVLEEAGVLVAIGVPEEWQIRHLLWEAAWQATNAGGKITRKQAVDWISRNFAKMFNVEISLDADFIAYKVSFCVLSILSIFTTANSTSLNIHCYLTSDSVTHFVSVRRSPGPRRLGSLLKTVLNMNSHVYIHHRIHSNKTLRASSPRSDIM